MVLRKGKFKPFSGPTKKGTFQTVEFGAGDAELIWRIANKNKSRKYAAIDPRLAPIMPTINLDAQRKSMEAVLENLKSNGIKTRHISIRMPNPKEVRDNQFRIEYLLSEAKNILIPNGKIFITSESGEIINKLLTLAPKYGYSVKQPKSLAAPKTRIERRFMGLERRPVYLVEITHRLKTAMPGSGKKAKEQRKNWAENALK